MSTIAKRVLDLEKDQIQVLANQKIILDNKEQSEKKLDTVYTTVIKIDKQMSNLVTQIKGEGGLFKRVDSLEGKAEKGENERDDIQLLIAKNTGRDARLVAFIFAFGIIIGFLTDKIADYYKDQLESRSKVGIILYHKPFEYGIFISTKVL